MKFCSGLIISAGVVDFVGEVTEVVGFVVLGYPGGPFFTSFVPIDAGVYTIKCGVFPENISERKQATGKDGH